MGRQEHKKVFFFFVANTYIFTNSEHVWRFHTPLYNCKDCGYYWTAVRNRKAIREEKEKHVCKSQDGGKKNRARARARNKAEIMSEKQQEELENVKAIKDIEKKLKVLYEACGKPIPETYREFSSKERRWEREREREKKGCWENIRTQC